MPRPPELSDPDRIPTPRTPIARPAMPGPGATTTESGLDFPSWRQLARLIGRALRLRCPNCGVGAVLRPYATVNAHCRQCRFHFERSSDSYFSGAMLTNLAVAEFLFAVVFGGVLIAAWPNVPWDLLGWAMPLGVFIAPILLLPFAKVCWLTFDVAFRPITPEEFDPKP